jgi:hypothetical protein
MPIMNRFVISRNLNVMLKEKFSLSFLFMSVVLMTSCGQSEDSDSKPDPTAEQQTENPKLNYEEPHAYGGWFCPDNLGGFPPVDVQELDKVPVVNDRLPTEEEAQNGTSLIYLDKSEYPDARHLEMELPRVARIYSNHNDMNELIIVIQAVVVGTDTVVGYRFPNGGNGSAWLGQVTFLSDEDVNAIGSAPFAYSSSAIDASQEEVWRAITSTSYAKQLGTTFNEQSFLKADWDGEAAHLNLDTEGVRAAGVVSSMWGSLYIHIDYDYDGFHYSEKLLVLNKEDGNAELHVVAGPYPDDIDSQSMMWENWLHEVKQASESR